MTEAKGDKGIKITDDLTARFWSCVDKRGDCWNWKAGLFIGGYGQFRMGDKKMRAHRVSFLMSGQTIPDGLLVCHTCDNTRCVNPDHLFLGTHKDNAMDRERKGRGSGNRFVKTGMNGSENPAAILTEETVKEIRDLHGGGGVTKRALAKKYDVSPSQISNITLRRSWTNV